MGARAFVSSVVLAPLALLVGQAALRADERLHVEPPPGQAAPAEPAGYRISDYRQTVPLTLKGATVLSPEKAVDLWRSGRAVFIDVYPRAPKPPNLPAGTLWREPPHYTIERAYWLANTGYGVLSDETLAYFREGLATLTRGDRTTPVVFFCLRNCWMSWNAAKRAMELGYTAVHWFPDGSDAWQEIGQLVVDVKPFKAR